MKIMQPSNPQSLPLLISSDSHSNKKKPRSTIKGKNIIAEMLKPVKIVKENKDVEGNFAKREEKQKEKITKKDMTNLPYKVIIKDKIITKGVEQVEETDFLVHKAIIGIDNDVEKFNKELGQKQTKIKEIDEYLDIEYAPEHYSSHKSNFEIKASFIKNMAYEQNTYDENKQDYIEFYRKKQKEAEAGLELCDQTLRSLVDNGVISKDELPCNESQIKSDFTSGSTDSEEATDKTNVSSLSKSEAPVEATVDAPPKPKLKVRTPLKPNSKIAPNKLAAKVTPNVPPKTTDSATAPKVASQTAPKIVSQTTPKSIPQTTPKVVSSTTPRTASNTQRMTHTQRLLTAHQAASNTAHKVTPVRQVIEI